MLSARTSLSNRVWLLLLPLTAIAIGVLYMKGMNPGPTVFMKNPSMLYAVFICFFLANLLLIPVITFYLLRDWDLIVAHIGALVPDAFAAYRRPVADAMTFFLERLSAAAPHTPALVITAHVTRRGLTLHALAVADGADGARFLQSFVDALG